MKSVMDDFKQTLEDAKSIDLVLASDSLGYMAVLHNVTKDSITYASNKIFVNADTYSLHFPLSSLAYKDDKWIASVSDTVLTFVLDFEEEEEAYD